LAVCGSAAIFDEIDFTYNGKIVLRLFIQERERYSLYAFLIQRSHRDIGEHCRPLAVNFNLNHHSSIIVSVSAISNQSGDLLLRSRHDR